MHFPWGVLLREISLLPCAEHDDRSLPLVMGLGVVFYQKVGDELTRLRDGGCFEIVGIG